MTNAMKTLLIGGMLTISTLVVPLAQAQVKVAVTNLAYEERVRECHQSRL